MPGRLDARPILAAVGAVLLLIALSLDWYIAPAVPPATEGVAIGNAWFVFESLDLVLAFCGAATLYLAYEQLTGRFRLGERWMLPVGLVALVVVASQILDAPPVAGLDPSATTGAWLALGGAGTIAVAGVLAVAKVSVAVVLDSAERPTRRRAAES